MPLDILLVIASIGTGLIAGLYLGVVSFALFVVAPTLIVLVAAALASHAVSAWIVPASWIGQQAGYLAMLWLVHGWSYRVMVERVRLIFRD